MLKFYDSINSHCVRYISYEPTRFFFYQFVDFKQTNKKQNNQNFYSN